MGKPQRYMVLFTSREQEEQLAVVGVVIDEEALGIWQLSAGDVTVWCFGRSPRMSCMFIPPESVRALEGYFQVDGAAQTLQMLAVGYAQYDCYIRIKELLRSLGAVFEEAEQIGGLAALHASMMNIYAEMM